MKEIERNNLFILIKNIYKHNSGGGYLHIVLDDGNLEDSHIEFCISEIEKSNEDTYVKQMYLDVAKTLLSLSMEERESIINYVWFGNIL